MNLSRITEIQGVVARFYGMSQAELLSRSKDRMFSHPRQVAMYLSRELSGHSTTIIGRWFHRDHSTICTGSKAVEKRAIASDELRRDLDKIRVRLAKLRAEAKLPSPLA
jgi:chromosomal replication initiator protein